MKKALLIGWKDLLTLFRDPAALSFMLAAPFLLTLGMGLVTGNTFRSSGSGIGQIPVRIFNGDEGPVGAALADVLLSRDLADLLSPSLMGDPSAAREAVDADKAAAAVLIPAGFTAGLTAASPPAVIVYVNPNSQTGAGVVEDVVREFTDRVRAMGAGAGAGTTRISLSTRTGGGEAGGFNALAFIAPGMALMFLMYRVTAGGGSLLTERAQGTLQRLMVSPTSAAQVLGGKVIGIYASGAAQVLILVLASTLIFRLRWGDPLGVLLLVLAAVAGATGWGLLAAALARSPGQVSGIGATLMCLFGILGGSFVRMDAMPAWVRAVRRITPNSWGLDGFATLAMGGTLADILAPIGALLSMGAALFVLSAFLLGRSGRADR